MQYQLLLDFLSISGRVLKFDLHNPTVEPFDITCHKGRLPIINLQFCTRQSLLFVTSLKECVLYHHMQPHVLISDQGEFFLIFSKTCLWNSVVAFGGLISH